MYVNDDSSTLDLVGCTFEENSASFGLDVSSENLGNVKISSCPAGYSGEVGAMIIYIGVGTITGEAKSYSCGACVR